MPKYYLTASVKPEVIFLIGLPGCGKTTRIKEFFENKPKRQYTIISSDNIMMEWARRDGLTYDEAKVKYDNIGTGNESPVHIATRSKMYGAIKHNNNIIIDQTNLSKASRATKLKMFPDHYIRKAIVFNVPLETLLQRQANPNRVGKSIPQDVMERMIASWEDPTMDEFQYITWVG